MIRMVGLTIGNFWNSFLHKNSSPILNKITRNGIKKSMWSTQNFGSFNSQNRSPRGIPQLSVIKCIVIAQLVWSLLSLNSSQARYPRVWWSVVSLLRHCGIHLHWMITPVLPHINTPHLTFTFFKGFFCKNTSRKKCLYDLWIQTYSWFWKRSI